MKYARHSTIEPKYDLLTLANKRCIDDVPLIIAEPETMSKSATWLDSPEAG